MSAALNPSWWHQPPPTPLAPLEALRVTAGHLHRGEAVPVEAARLVAEALERYLRGEAPSINAALGLCAAPGQRSPINADRAARRNELLRLVLQGMEGPAGRRAERLVQLLHGPSVEAPTDSALRAAIEELRRDHASTLPRSSRHLQRILVQG